MKNPKSETLSEILSRNARQSRGHYARVTVCLAALMAASVDPGLAQLAAPSAGVDTSSTLVGGPATNLDPSTPIATAKVLYVKEKEGDSRIWESVATATNSLGQISSKTNLIQELATGMNYLDGTEWKTSDASFTEAKDEFVADKVQHRSRIKRDLNVGGAVFVTTPDQQQIYSTPVALGIYEPQDGKFLVVGEITNCSGIAVSNNLLVYQDPFVDSAGRRLCGALVYSISQSSFEQDYVWQGYFDVRDYGFSTNAWVQVISEIQSAPEPDIIERPVYIEQDEKLRASMVTPDMIDQTIGFGEFVLNAGHAYTSPTGGLTNGAEAVVAKQLRRDGDRLLLIESVPYSALQEGFQSLPPCVPSGQASVTPKARSKTSYAAIASPPKIAKVDAPKRKSAEMAGLTGRPLGVVIDYLGVLGGTLTNTTVFASSTNYIITGNVICNGPVIIEGGTIFKYKTNMSMTINSSLTLKTSMYRPAVFTALDDTTVGDLLSTNVDSSYTGTINTNGYANPALSCPQTPAYAISHCRFCYAQAAIKYNNANGSVLTVNHSQFWKCIRGIQLAYGGCGCGTCGMTLTVNNTLMGYVNYPITTPQVVSSYANLINCTFDHATTLLSGWANTTVRATNSLFSSVTNWGWTPGGDHNGFYASPAAFGTSTNYRPTASGTPFQPVGRGSYYLLSGVEFKDAGRNTGISTSLLTDLHRRTTCPPNITPRSITTNTTLSPQNFADVDPIDIGYHYPVLDHALGAVTVTNCKLTITSGTILATYATNSVTTGLAISTGGQFLPTGTPTQPVWIVDYNTVQEGSTTNWQKTSFASVSSGQTSYPTINCRFTDWSMLGLDDYQFRSQSGAGAINFQDSEFYGGMVLTAGPILNFTNCLFERVESDIQPTNAGWSYFRNNTFFGGKFGYGPAQSVVQDNLFDQPTIPNLSAQMTSYVGGSNAYVTSTANRVHPPDISPIILTASPAYNTGFLGSYYLPDTSTNLIDHGSTLANLVGLYQYTVMTNLDSGLQRKEGLSTVDVGYHYMALNASNLPIDSNGNGIADYLEDVDGDGLPDDGDGDGLPSWWETEWGLDPLNPDSGNTGIPDGYKNPAGDGWNNEYKYEHGMDPTQFYTPPPPQNVAAQVDVTGTKVILTWASGGGPVTNYVIYAGTFGLAASQFSSIGAVSASTFTFTNTPDCALIGGDCQQPVYFICAYFANGSHADSQQVGAYKAGLDADVRLTRGPLGQRYLAVASQPPNLSRILLFWDKPDFTTGSLNIYASNLVNGIAPVPAMVGYGDADLYGFQMIATNGDFGEAFAEYPYPSSEWRGSRASQYAFVDARRHLKENLKFLLRSATLNRPFSYTSNLRTDTSTHTGDAEPYFTSQPEYYYARPASPTSYEYYGYHFFSSNLNYSFIQELRPVQENYLWRNFVFDPGDYDLTGADFYSDPGTTTFIRTLADPLHEYSGSGTETNLALAFTTTNSTWLYFRWVSNNPSDTDANPETGISVNANHKLVVSTSSQNCYGLTNSSVYVANSGVSDAVLLPGVPSTDAAAYAYEYYPGAVTPALQAVDYYFVSQTPHFLFGTPRAPLPGSPDFTNTNSSPLLVTSIGQPITVAGWAKMMITNGYSGKYGYLEQYFESAYKVGTNGLTTTNKTGVLSPYGEFFPTEPGPTALVTMPDIDTGQRGTGVVNVIKLQLDVNHDGAMDLSFGGPDNTFSDRPFVFWLNNNYDRGHDVDCTAIIGGNCDWEEDDVSPNDPAATCPFTPKKATIDSEYKDFYGDRQIPSQRDLEDFTRLWVCGISTNVLSSLPPGTTVTLSWDDVGNPNPTNPTIDLFQAADPDGGTGYLTNTITATNQLDRYQCGCIGRLGPGGSIQLNLDVFGSHWRGNYFIWCGVTNGTGALTLTIAQGGTNVLARTSTYIQLLDIKQMYERWTCGDNPKLAPTNTSYLAGEDLPTGVPAFQYGSLGTSNTPYILFVHGWNMNRYDKDRFAETAFKRVYWQGYQGRFGLFRWPTLYAFPAGEISKQAFNPDNFDTSEFASWMSGAPLRKLLVQLNNEYPGQVRMFAHSHGNIAAGEALRTNATLVHTYVAMQAAVPSHAYDPTTTNRSLGSWDSSTPERTAQYWTNGAPAYFSANAGAAHCANFFNFNDWALAWWMTDQNLKPDIGYSWEWADPELYKFTPFFGLVRNLYFPQDKYEIFSYITEGRCFALGQQVNVHGAFDPTLQTDLSLAPYNLDNTHKGHSGQFRSNNARRAPIWNSVLQAMDLK